ncbi:SDR family oxidoreductase [Microbacterium lushaniae]|uniref:SDR family oxidoreductase n=1 Tax=Microbacterium lushaniae TaxID=2614639 RepID=A0A5J6L481_9MICO|nr:SDR family oxidoreductase [Microbacterium lushaniae]
MGGILRATLCANESGHVNPSNDAATHSGTFDVPHDPIARGGSPWLKDKVALVAGGGLSGPEGGVGFAIAWLAAREGAAVAILDRDSEAADRAVRLLHEAGARAERFVLDMTDDHAVAAAVEAVVERFGGIDVVADSIGGLGLEPTLESSVEQWERAFALNLTQAWSLLRHAHRHVRSGGAIVTISSSAAQATGPSLPYSIAKGALEKMTTGLAATLAPRGIRANVVRVGMIWGAFAARGMTPDQREQRRRAVALGTEGTVWDVAAAAVFLLTDQARWVSGQTLAVDGGGFAPRNMGQAGAKPEPGKS